MVSDPAEYAGAKKLNPIPRGVNIWETLANLLLGLSQTFRTQSTYFGTYLFSRFLSYTNLSNREILLLLMEISLA